MANDESDSQPKGGRVVSNGLPVLTHTNPEGEPPGVIVPGLPAIRTASDISKDTKRTAAWEAIVSHTEKWFWDFDQEAYRIALCCVIAHMFGSEEPVWLFILGGAGSGKTVMINSLNAVENTHHIGSLTPVTLLSGFKNGKCSLLLRVGDKPILLFKDFTTFLSQRPEIRAEIASQLREVYDGKLTRDTGATSKPLEWIGKATVLAGCTPAVEKAWTLLRDLGERFCTVRWARKDGIEVARKAVTQIPFEKEISTKLREYVKTLLANIGTPAKTPPEKEYESLLYLAECTARARSHVSRDTEGRRHINDVPEAELGTRLVKAFVQLSKAHATLFGREVFNQDDMKLARRIAMDSIPNSRRRVMDILIREATGKGDGAVTCADLAKEIGLPMHTILWIRDELESARVICTENTDGTGEDSASKWCAFREDYADMLKRAGLLK